MVLVEAFATATPVVASDIPGFADVADAGRGDARAARATRPRWRRRRRDCSPTRSAASRWAAPRARSPSERYAWTDIARRLEAIYERVAA